MKIAVAGDPHGVAVWYRGLILTAAAAGAGLLLIVGDTGLLWPDRDFHRLPRSISRWAARSGVTVGIIRGNHDCVDALGALEVGPDGLAWLTPELFYIPDGVTFTWGEVVIAGLGGATSHDRTWRLEEEAKKRRPRTLFWPEEVVPESAVERWKAVQHRLTCRPPTRSLHRRCEASAQAGQLANRPLQLPPSETPS